MNRKKASKIKKQIETQIASAHPFDDVEKWLDSASWQKCPWSDEKMASFQKQIDSAFGAENAIILCWSADRRYGDVFINEKHQLERKPPLVFGEIKVNETDYVYLGAPRFLLMQVLHGSQLEDSWEASSWSNDEYGVPHRIRPEKAPEFFYDHLRVIATHERVGSNGIPECCERLWRNGKRACYGKYREPNFNDIEFVGRTAENMRLAGVAQRNDTSRDAKVLLDAQLGAKHFREATTLRKANAMKEMMMANSGSFFQGILDKLGSTMTPRERDEIVLGALEAQDDERFSQKVG